jgi:nucleotide-binding universal stress UspA family protein
MPPTPTKARRHPTRSPPRGSASDNGTVPPARSARRRGPCFVVGYDGSPEARHAAGWAARRAAPNGKLVLIHACRPRHRWLPLAFLRTAFERRDRGRALIDELFMDGDEALLDVQVQATVLDADPAHALIAAARRHEAQEIIVGSHRRSHLDALHGDVAAELVRSAPVPVCVVPLGSDPDPAAARQSPE